MALVASELLILNMKDSKSFLAEASSRNEIASKDLARCHLISALESPEVVEGEDRPSDVLEI